MDANGTLTRFIFDFGKCFPFVAFLFVIVNILKSVRFAALYSHFTKIIMFFMNAKSEQQFCCNEYETFCIGNEQISFLNRHL